MNREDLKLYALVAALIWARRLVLLVLLVGFGLAMCSSDGTSWWVEP